MTVEINATELFDHDPDYDDEEDSALYVLPRLHTYLCIGLDKSGIR